MVHCSSLYRQLIYNYPEQLFADANVMAIEHADFEGIERLALVLGNVHAHMYINNRKLHTVKSIITFHVVINFFSQLSQISIFLP